MTKAFDEVTRYLSGNNKDFDDSWARQLLLDAQEFQRRSESAVNTEAQSGWAQTAANYLTAWELYRKFEYGNL